MHNLIKNIANSYLDYRAFKTDRKLLVIESDDWGSLRTRDPKTLIKLNQISPAVANDRFTQLDSIANEDDLDELFTTLASVKDKFGNPACITANVCTANPDFERIRASEYNMFYYQSFRQALKEQSDGQDLFSFWKQGMDQRLFMPQLHGREHLHALAWLSELRVGNKALLEAFELGSWGIPYVANTRQRRNNLQAPLDLYSIKGEKGYHRQWIIDAASIFKKEFGFNSASFIAPAYIWHSDMHYQIRSLGIKSLQGIKLQYQPRVRGYKRLVHFIGEHYKQNDIFFFPRNVFFEPSNRPEIDWDSRTLKGIDNAFQNKQPAIIGSHRVNFMGGIDESNRTKNIATLKKILRKTVEEYPDVEFISSDQLIDIVVQ